ncbi:hypothetical protein Pst134EA_017531 [Puccinia striiformis f. sp. tritici]|uniref:hypothetical protein n=1 Tax=Puccinia striiformis f. sp. tritici TaxID=168172 RepID=UPI0020074C1E|nr:hypothetical protein Pst134EA_017531 [Puccinia striiformis f. sp. tritici]KAH9450920.1 hypothetical protein Pst134EB_018429 [Puccinia striiformis f. sp. tritici]KAH9461222.1 hypothetical protein Pst134EA_017531 [Puccinia striiformis f. sp. tritici]KAI9607293.1 hypothetical protein H4Q26_005810 [Puccinia striiformis f. sp. tritici PST-130]KAI9615274.1 hypothetical protein KEM48_005702 [Puccinia striiformis f. sp. tritici PST-130]
MTLGTLTMLLFILFPATVVLGSPLPSTFHRLERRYNGKATWFYPNIGACGDTNSKFDYIIAMNHVQYGNGQLCHKSVQIVNEATGKSVVAKITDKCPGCDYGSVDLSPAVFKELGELKTGTLPVTWNFE